MADPLTWLSELEANPVSGALLASDSTIVAVNRTWERFAFENGLLDPRFGVGTRYLDISVGSLGPDHRFVADLKRLLARKLAFLTWTYECSSPTAERWFTTIGFPLKGSEPAAALLHIDIGSMIGGAGGVGQIALSRAALLPDTLTSNSGHATQARSRRKGMSRTQRRVSQLMAEGQSDQEIAEKLRLQVARVQVLVEEISRILAVSDRETARAILKHGKL